MKIIDLSQNIENKMQVYPLDPKTEIRDYFNTEKDGYRVSEIKMSAHSATHIDFPNHILKNAKTLDDYPLEKFVGKGIIIDVSNKGDDEHIDICDIEKYKEKIESVKILVFYTGYSKYFNSEKYIHHPFLSYDAVKYIETFNLDICAVDAFGLDSSFFENELYAHTNLLKRDILIVENLTNLDLLTNEKEYEFHFMPLKIKNSEASMVRAYVYIR